MNKFIFTIVFIFFSTSKALAAGPSIKILSAFSGEQSFTKKAQKLCENMFVCHLDMRTHIPLPKVADKSINIKWYCENGKTPEIVKEIKTEHGASEKIITLYCQSGKSKHGYRDYLIRDDMVKIMESRIGQECSRATQATLQKYKRLKSSMLMKLITPLTDYVPELTFFHRTQAASFANNMKDKEVILSEKVKTIFDYLRLTGGRYPGHLYQEERVLGWRNFYLSRNDDGTISRFGPHRIQIKMKPTSLILKYDSKVWAKALKQFAIDYPLIGQSCNLNQRTIRDALGPVDFNNFISVLATELGVDVLDYNQQDKWFMLLDGSSIESIQ